jgi:HKD family nuclease
MSSRTRELPHRSEREIRQPPPIPSPCTGQPHSPLWKSIGQRVSSAAEVDLLASFIQPSGLDLIQLSIFSALRAGAKIRILVGDYLYITSAEALRRLVGWMSLADDISKTARSKSAGGNLKTPIQA